VEKKSLTYRAKLSTSSSSEHVSYKGEGNYSKDEQRARYIVNTYDVKSTSILNITLRYHTLGLSNYEEDKINPTLLLD
jgi:hypothetical protein